MINEIIGRTIDNGFNIPEAVKDTFEFRKNKKNLNKNIINYKSLMSDKFGISVEEFSVMGEDGLYVNIFLTDKIIDYSIFKGSHSKDSIYKTVTMINNGQEKDFYFANTLASHINNIKDGKAVLIDKNNSSFVDIIHNYLSKNPIKDYIVLSELQEAILNDIL